MPKYSAGLLMYRRVQSELQVLLVHPGGPFWAKKDVGAWSLPKGEYESPEEPLVAAQREFEEETGFVARGPFIPLGEVKQSSAKTVTAWAFEDDCDPAQLKSNTCDVEWPPRSGKTIQIPEVDRAEWFTIADARTRLLKGQVPFLDRLTAALAK